MINVKSKSFDDYKSNHEFELNLIKSEREKLLKENENLKTPKIERISSTVNHSFVMTNRFQPKIIKFESSRNHISPRSLDESYMKDLPEKLLPIKENENLIVSEEIPEILKVTKCAPKNFLFIWINFCFFLYLKYEFFD